MLANVTNTTENTVSCNNSEITCLTSQCWNGTYDTAVVMRVPTYVPIPVKVDTGTFPVSILHRTRRDFRIMAALVTTIAVSAAAAMTAAVAMAATIQTAEIVNKIVEKNSRHTNHCKIY